MHAVKISFILALNSRPSIGTSLVAATGCFSLGGGVAEREYLRLEIGDWGVEIDNARRAHIKAANAAATGRSFLHHAAMGVKG